MVSGSRSIGRTCRLGRLFPGEVGVRLVGPFTSFVLVRRGPYRPPFPGALDDAPEPCRAALRGDAVLRAPRGAPSDATALAAIVGLMVQEPLVGGADAFGEWRFGFPAELAETLDV